jgi:hypothetical protein
MWEWLNWRQAGQGALGPTTCPYCIGARAGVLYTLAVVFVVAVAIQCRKAG